MSLLLLLDSSPPGADISFNGPMLALPYSLQRLGFTYVRNSLKTVYQGGSLVTLAANQFGTTYDSVTGLHAFEAEPAATNLALNSILAGGGAAPTSWTQTIATGTSAPAVSIYGTASGAIAYMQTATAQRPFISQTFAASANTTYNVSVLIESRTGTLAASDVLTLSAVPAGATVTFPVCEANPSGGAGALGTGKLLVQVVVAGTAGNVITRVGLGGAGAVTGTLQFSRPQFETGLRRTSWIATTTGTVTRAADVLSCATANVPGFSAAGYTLVGDARQDVVTGLTSYVCAINKDGNDRAAIYTASSAARTISISGGVTGVNQVGANPATSRFKFAFSATANLFSAALNGSALTQDTSGNMPVGPVNFEIGGIAGSSLFNGYIYRVRLIPTALNQAQTTGLTV